MHHNETTYLTVVNARCSLDDLTRKPRRDALEVEVLRGGLGDESVPFELLREVGDVRPGRRGWSVERDKLVDHLLNAVWGTRKRVISSLAHGGREGGEDSQLPGLERRLVAISPESLETVQPAENTLRFVHLRAKNGH